MLGSLIPIISLCLILPVGMQILFGDNANYEIKIFLFLYEKTKIPKYVSSKSFFLFIYLE